MKWNCIPILPSSQVPGFINPRLETHEVLMFGITLIVEQPYSFLSKSMASIYWNSLGYNDLCFVPCSRAPHSGAPGARVNEYLNTLR